MNPAPPVMSKRISPSSAYRSTIALHACKAFGDGGAIACCLSVGDRHAVDRSPRMIYMQIVSVQGRMMGIASRVSYIVVFGFRSSVMP